MRHSVFTVSRRQTSSLHIWLERLFFFFQAEDGIRDLTVTGVQTCALPISYLRPYYTSAGQHARAIGRRVVGAEIGPFAQQGLDEAFGLAVGARRIRPRATMRSAARRVGKARRSRWAPYHYNRKCYSK